jgi:hypothetical protein
MVETRTDTDGAVSRVQFERWEASTPPYDSREIRTAAGRSFEAALVGGNAQVYDPATNTVYEQPSPKAGYQKPGSKPGGDGGDPYRNKMLTLLQTGYLHADGHTTVDGRDAIRLVSDDRTSTLAVDPDTYEPIQWRVDRGSEGVEDDRFVVYERLPASDALLSPVAQHPGATVDDDPADYAAALDRLSPKKAQDSGTKSSSSR